MELVNKANEKKVSNLNITAVDLMMKDRYFLNSATETYTLKIRMAGSSQTLSCQLDTGGRGLRSKYGVFETRNVEGWLSRLLACGPCIIAFQRLRRQGTNQRALFWACSSSLLQNSARS
jgi:hypothetical protein